MRRRTITTALVALTALALPSVAAAADRDRDRMPDGWEKRNGLNPKKNDARKDRDRDGLRNLDEYRTDNNPRRADSDGDGTRDGDEGAGRIASFDEATGVLTIDLFGGGQLTGKVDATTEIECEDEERDCSPADLTVNRIVEEAELHDGDDGDPTVFDEIELG